MPDIMSDIADCVEYIRGDEFREATGGKADARRMTISGGSAGGWLALLASTGVGFEACGLKAPAPPLVCAAIYPITDLLDPFWTTKQVRDDNARSFVTAQMVVSRSPSLLTSREGSKPTR